MSDWNYIKINYIKIKFCPFCGNEVIHSSYYQEEDDLHYRGNVSEVKCKNCNRILYNSEVGGQCHE